MSELTDKVRELLDLFDDIAVKPGECGLIDVWNQFGEKHAAEYHLFHRLEGKGTAWGVKK